MLLSDNFCYTQLSFANNKMCLRSVSSLITGVQSMPSTCLGGLVQQVVGVGRDGGIIPVI